MATDRSRNVVGQVTDAVSVLAFVLTAAGLLVVGYVTGFLTVSLNLDIGALAVSVGVLEAKLSVVFFGAFIAVSAVVFVAGTRRRRGAPPTDAGQVTALVPVYRDHGVLHRSVESLCESDYDDLEVVVVCEPDDNATQQRAAQLAKRDGVEYLVNTESPGSKAGAINYAVRETDGEYVAVFDADERVHPEFVPQAVADLQDADVVQGRTVPEPTGFVETLAYYESVLLNYVALQLLSTLTDFTMAASRAVVLRREALAAVDGYDETMLTEDFAFAHECYRERLEVTELFAYPSRIDAAHSLRDWWGQRKRWMTGYAQVFHHLLAGARPLTDYRNLLSMGLAATTVLGSLFLLTVLSKFAVLLAVGALAAFVAPLLVVAAVAYTVHWQDHRRGLVSSPGLTGLLAPLMLPIYSLTAIKAVFEYVFTWTGEWYQVSKEG